MFVLLPSWGLSNAAATLVGQNLGAGKPERAEASVWRAALYNVVFLGMVGVVFVAFADIDRRRVHRAIRQVAPIAVRGLRIISAGFPFYAAGYVLTQSFNGAGDTMTPTLINIAAASGSARFRSPTCSPARSGSVRPACSGRSRSRSRRCRSSARRCSGGALEAEARLKRLSRGERRAASLESVA